MRYGHTIGIGGQFLARLAEQAIPTLADLYPELEQQREAICAALDEEETRFGRTLRRGEAEFEKVGRPIKAAAVVPGEVVFRLYDTYGFPAELTQELAEQRGLVADMPGFESAFAAHQRRSRQGRGRALPRRPGRAHPRDHQATYRHAPAARGAAAGARPAVGAAWQQHHSRAPALRFHHGERLTPSGSLRSRIWSTRRLIVIWSFHMAR